MAFHGKIVSIRGNKVNTIICTSSANINNLMTKFLALGIYARDSILDVTKLGQKGFKVYSLNCHYPLNSNYTFNKDSEIIKDNKFGFGVLSRYLRDKFNDSFCIEDFKDCYFPYMVISANHNMNNDSIGEYNSSLDEVTKDSSYYYSFIIDYDNKVLRMVTYDDDVIENKIDFTFKDLTMALEQDLSIYLLARLFNHNSNIIDEQKENYFEEINQLLSCEAFNRGNTEELIKNSIFILNKSNKPSSILEKLKSC